MFAFALAYLLLSAPFRTAESFDVYYYNYYSIYFGYQRVRITDNATSWQDRLRLRSLQSFPGTVAITRLEACSTRTVVPEKEEELHLGKDAT